LVCAGDLPHRGLFDVSQPFDGADRYHDLRLKRWVDERTPDEGNKMNIKAIDTDVQILGRWAYVIKIVNNRYIDVEFRRLYKIDEAREVIGKMQNMWPDTLCTATVDPEWDKHRRAGVPFAHPPKGYIIKVERIPIHKIECVRIDK
jgi:hypothetical protein